MIGRNVQQLFRKKNAGYTDNRQKKRVVPGSLLCFLEYSTRGFTILFVESRNFLLDPARDVGGSVFNADLFRFGSRQELHSRPIHERYVP